MNRHRLGLSKYGCALAALVTASALLAPAVAHGGHRPVRLGEVTARQGGESLVGFRRVLEEELGALELGEARQSGSFVLSASLVKLETRAERDEAVASCVVSAVLRSARGGAIVAMLRGSGRVTDAPTELESARRDALRAATRSAVRRVPDAVQSAR